MDKEVPEVKSKRHQKSYLRAVNQAREIVQRKATFPCILYTPNFANFDRDCF